MSKEETKSMARGSWNKDLSKTLQVIQEYPVTKDKLIHRAQVAEAASDELIDFFEAIPSRVEMMSADEVKREVRRSRRKTPKLA